MTKRAVAVIETRTSHARLSLWRSDRQRQPLRRPLQHQTSHETTPTRDPRRHPADPNTEKTVKCGRADTGRSARTRRNRPERSRLLGLGRRTAFTGEMAALGPHHSVGRRRSSHRLRSCILLPLRLRRPSWRSRWSRDRCSRRSASVRCRGPSGCATTRSRPGRRGGARKRTETARMRVGVRAADTRVLAHLRPDSWTCAVGSAAVQQPGATAAVLEDEMRGRVGVGRLASDLADLPVGQHRQLSAAVGTRDLLSHRVIVDGWMAARVEANVTHAARPGGRSPT